mgnify:CR=1 FL=1
MKKRMAVLICLMLVLSGCAKPSAPTAPSADAASQTGSYQDITDWHGNVVGVSYVNATNEITIRMAENQLLVTFVDPQKEPFREAEQLGIEAYQILDSQGALVKEGSVPAAQVVSGQASIPLETEGLAPGQYLLNITAFVAEKKADQPLTISGCWQASLEI